MAYDNRPNLSSARFDQSTGDTLNLCGTNCIIGLGTISSNSGYKISGATILKTGEQIHTILLGCNTQGRGAGLAIGSAAHSMGVGSISIGCGSCACGLHSIAIGNSSKSFCNQGTIIGANSINCAIGSTIIGGCNNLICSASTNTVLINGVDYIMENSDLSNYVVIPKLAIYETPDGTGNFLCWNSITKKVGLSQTVSSVTEFTGLTDTPNNYIPNYFVTVNSGGTALEYENIDDVLSESFPIGLEGEVYFINQDNTRTTEADFTVTKAVVVENDVEFNIATGETITLEDIFNTWERISHWYASNEYLTTYYGSYTPPYPTQTPPVFPATDPENPIAPFTLEDFYATGSSALWKYGYASWVGTNAIYTTANYNPLLGFISPNKYDDYTLDVKMGSDNSDNDFIGIIIAFNRDGETDFEYTLTAYVTTNKDDSGAVRYAIEYNKNQNITGSTAYNPVYSENSAEIIVNGTSLLTLPTVDGWSSNSPVRMNISRNGDIIQVKISQYGSTVIDESTLLEIDLRDYPKLSRFRGPNQWGVFAQSQENSALYDLDFSGFGNYIFYPHDGGITHDTWEYDYDSTSWFLQNPQTLTLHEYVGVGRIVNSHYFGKLYYTEYGGNIDKLASGGVSGSTYVSGVTSAENVTKPIYLPNHGFSLTDVIGWSGGTYNKAIADDTYSGETIGIVSKVVDGDNFYLTQSGYITGLTGLVTNSTYFLSDSTAGGIRTTKPTDVGHMVRAIMVADSTTSAWVLPYTGYVIESGDTANVRFFTDLQDVPVDYSGSTNKFVRVNESGDGLIFADPPIATTENIKKRIYQSSHGFSMMDVIGWSGGTYSKAIADGSYDGEVLGIVSEYVDENTFDLTFAGYITGLTGLVTNSTYYLSDSTQGLLTSTQPSTDGHVVKPILVAESTTSAWVLPYVGYLLDSGSTENSFIDLSDTPSTYVGNDGKYLKVSGTSLVFTDAPSGGGVVDVTYDSLVGLITSSGLTTGSKYRITDYRTIHYIQDGYDVTTDINTGNTESLIVTAIDIDKIDKVAISQQYPQDIIWYDWNPDNWIRDIGFAAWDEVIIDGFRGVIYFRHDTINNNSIGYDFRNVKFRRWKIVDDDGMFNFTGDTNSWINSYQSTSSVNYNHTVVDINDYVDVLTFSSPIGVDYYNNLVKSNSFNLLHEDFDYSYYSATILLNNVFYLKDNNLVYLNCFGYFRENTFNGGVFVNTFGNNLYNNIIGSSYCYNTNNSVDFSDNTISCGFVENVISGIFYCNRINCNFENNKINTFFHLNSIGCSVKFNFFNGCRFSNNDIDNNFSINTINGEFERNTISGNFQYNTIDSMFYDNVFNGSSNDNYFCVVGNNVIELGSSNNIIYSLNGNSIGSVFTNNFIVGLQSSTIGNYFNGNCIGACVAFINITGGTDYNNSFRFNEIKIFVRGLNSGSLLDLTQPEYYSCQHTETYIRPDGGIRMMYYDNSDERIVKLPTI